MRYDLIKLLGIQESDILRTQSALFIKKATWFAPEAYLHIIYPALELLEIRHRWERLHLPDSLIRFYKEINGVSLFLDTLRIYGFWREGALLRREDPAWDCPYNLESANDEVSGTIPSGYLLIGSYDVDGSMICIDQRAEKVICFVGTQFRQRRKEWGSMSVFLTSEITRLRSAFDEQGRQLVVDTLLLPDALIQ